LGFAIAPFFLKYKLRPHEAKDIKMLTCAAEFHRGSRENMTTTKKFLWCLVKIGFAAPLTRGSLACQGLLHSQN
jgi:hypothetical protein